MILNISIDPKKILGDALDANGRMRVITIAVDTRTASTYCWLETRGDESAGSGLCYRGLDVGERGGLSLR